MENNINIAEYQINLLNSENSRVARTDKRELLRIAQEVQASHRIRRTCLPILKLPPSLTMTLPSETVGRQSITSFHKRREYKKPEEVRMTTSAENTRALPTKNLTQDGQTQKRRKIFTNTGKEIKREYLKVKTVNLNLEDLPTSDFTKKPVLPNLYKNIQPNEAMNKFKINPKIRNQTQNISKILVNEDEYRMTINEDGHFEDINISLLPMMNSIQNYYTENYFQLPPKINDDVEKLIVVTTASGTTFEMKQPKTTVPNNFYEKTQTIKKLFPIATRKKIN